MPDNIDTILAIFAAICGTICGVLCIYAIYNYKKSKGCRFCNNEDSFGSCLNHNFRVEPSGRGYIITSEVFTGQDLNGHDSFAYGETQHIKHCPMCGRYLY